MDWGKKSSDGKDSIAAGAGDSSQVTSESEVFPQFLTTLSCDNIVISIINISIHINISSIMFDMEDFDQIQTAEFREAFNEFDKVIIFLIN